MFRFTVQWLTLPFGTDSLQCMWISGSLTFPTYMPRVQPQIRAFELIDTAESSPQSMCLDGSQWTSFIWFNIRAFSVYPLYIVLLSCLFPGGRRDVGILNMIPFGSLRLMILNQAVQVSCKTFYKLATLDVSVRYGCVICHCFLEVLSSTQAIYQ